MSRTETNSRPAGGSGPPDRDAPPARRRLARALGVALAATLVIFGGWELIERTWPGGWSEPARHWLHLVRGISSALLVTALAGWMILTTSPGILQLPPTLRPTPLQSGVTDGERIRSYARWFIAMRWIAVLLAAILVFISVQVLEWLPQAVWWPLVCTVGVLVGTNVLYMILLPWRRTAPLLLLVQGYVDLVILTFLLHFSGGIENPVCTMMIFHVIIGGILLSRAQCFGIAAAASLLFATLAFAEWSGVSAHHTLEVLPHVEAHHGARIHPAFNTLYVVSGSILQASVLFLTAYFVTTLAKRLRDNERQLVAMADRALADQQLLERALETTGAGLRVLDRELRPYWSSHHWDQWFVCRSNEVCPGCAVLQDDASPARQCLEDGRVRMTEIVLEATNAPARLLPAGGGQRVLHVTTAPLLDANGAIAQVVELAQDITEQKQTHARMLHAGKLAAVGELAGQVAHEVNNPISVISGKASLLLSDHAAELTPKVAQELTKITELARRVARIAQGLLAYCRPSAATRVRLDLHAPIRKCLAAVEEPAKRGAIRIEDQITDPLPVVKANPLEVEQVFLNLFTNAVDAMPKGGWLTVSRSTDAAFPDGRPAVAIVVADTGCGIPDEIRSRIFEPFFTTKQDGRGTGLGLSICLGIVRGHGGEIEVQSKRWQGTCVTIKLPIDAPVVKEDPHHG